jgi:hypothetical protein
MRLSIASNASSNISSTFSSTLESVFPLAAWICGYSIVFGAVSLATGYIAVELVGCGV